jgi:hypothetical protein
MCGLVGFVGKIGYKEEQAFKLMLKLDVIRGEDSTGVASVNATGKIKMAKKAALPWELFETDEYKKAVDQNQSLCLIGHNRAATKGVINDNNAHPFEFDNVVGAHNGTLRGQSLLEDYKNFDVDSENIYHHMSIHGAEHTLHRLNGAFALAFYDKKEDYLGLVRNNERPLYFCFCNDGDTVGWASEPWILAVALSKNGIKYNDIREVEEQKLYRFPLPDHTNQKFAGRWSAEVVKFYKWEDFYKNTNQGRQPFNHTDELSKAERKALKKLDKKNTFAVSQEYLNKPTVFSAARYVTNYRGDCYVRCYTVDENEVEVRTYCEKDSPLYKKLMNTSMYVKAQVRSVSWENNKPYLMINSDSLEDIEPEAYEKLSKQIELEVQTDVVQVTGPNNTKISPLQWLEATADGCFSCTIIPYRRDADKLEWVTDKEFLCPDCAKGPEGVTARLILNDRKQVVGD